MKRSKLKELIYRYEAANFVIERRLSVMLRDLMPEELTVDQFKTMRYLRQRGQGTSSELADIFCVGKSSITAIITRLSDKGLIQRLPQENDRRVINLILTKEGELICDRMDEKVQELLASFLGHFEEREALVFMETFEKLASIMSKSLEGK